MMLVANLTNTKWCKRKKDLKSLHIATHLRLLSESYPMNTNLTWFIQFSKNFLYPCALDESSLSIGRVKSNQILPLSTYFFN